MDLYHLTPDQVDALPVTFVDELFLFLNARADHYEDARRAQED